MAWNEQNQPGTSGYARPASASAPFSAAPGMPGSAAGPMVAAPNMAPAPMPGQVMDQVPIPAPNQFGPMPNAMNQPPAPMNQLVNPLNPANMAPTPAMNMAPPAPQPGATSGERFMPNEVYNSPGAANPNTLQAPPMPQPAVQANPVPIQGQPMMPTGVPVKLDEDATKGDMLWINRIKQAIAQTHGDPHRQVQLIQQLRVTFLKERFGHNVQTKDK